MAGTDFYIFAASDDNLLKAIYSICKECESTDQSRISLQFASGHKAIEAQIREIGQNPVIHQVISTESKIFYQISTTFPSLNLSLTITREDGRDKVHVGIDEKSSHDHEALARLLIATRKHFQPYDLALNRARILGPELAAFYAKREEGLFRLEQLNEKLIHQNEEYRRELDKEHDKLVYRLEEDFAKRREALDAEFQKKEEQLTDRENDLDQKLKVLDDRSSRHARRQLRQDLKTLIENRNKDFRLTQTTNRKRVPAHVRGNASKHEENRGWSLTGGQACGRLSGHASVKEVQQCPQLPEPRFTSILPR